MAKTAQQKKDSAKDARLKKFFRVSLEEYRAIEKHQVDCGLGLLLGTTRRALDHSHKTGLVRGVLDWRINRALGWIEDMFGWQTSEVLNMLANYYDDPPATELLGAPRYGIIGRAKNKKKMVYGSSAGEKEWPI